MKENPRSNPPATEDRGSLAHVLIGIEREIEKYTNDAGSLETHIKAHRETIRFQRQRIKIAQEDINKQTGKIAELSKNTKGTGLGPSSLSSKEKSQFDEVFRKVANQFFSTISEPGLSSKGKDNEDSRDFTETVAKVDIEYEKQCVSFFIGHKTDFLTLRKRAAKYWSLPEEDIFFTVIENLGLF